jgi:hypothetical protein
MKVTTGAIRVFGTFYLREAISSLWLTLERYQERFGKAFHPDSSALHGNFTSCLLGFLREHRSTTLNGWEACNPVRRSLGIIHHFFHYQSMDTAKSALVHPVWSLAVVAFGLMAPQSAESPGMGYLIF